jgi:flagellar biosynthesis/type III secretory pathway M-ring protein FliF/YscJ
MNFFKAQLDRLGKQAAQLNASQKMLAGSLLVIMMITLVLWGKYASSPEVEAVLDQPMAPDEIAQIKDFLAARGFSPKVVGDRVMVASERRLEAFSDISFAQLLPRDTTSAFDVILSKMSPWDPSSKTEVMWNEMKQMHLAQVMRGWPGVADARVMIDQKEKHGLTPTPPSAMADIRTRPGDRVDKQLMMAAVALIRGSVSGIDPSRISVIIDGVSRRVQDSAGGSFMGSDELSLRREAEQRYADNVKERLAYIDGVVVVVAAEVNTKAIDEQTTKIDSKGTVQKEIESFSKSDETTSAQSSGEPGVGSNIEAKVQQSSGDKGKTSNTEETNKYIVEVPKTVTQTREVPGRATIKSATVGVPRSYFVKMYKVLNPNDKDVNPATLDDVMAKELARITKQVKAAINLTDDAMVAVDSYVDVNPVMMAAAQTVAVSASSGVGNMLGGHIREVGAGVLALISLFMVSMMVKKSAAPDVAAVTGGPQIPFEAGESVAGEAGAGGATLDGMELDEESVKAQEVIGQVSTLVRENPDAAATLVKRWLNR